MRLLIIFIWLLALGLISLSKVFSQTKISPPTIPIGVDAYLAWEQLPYLRYGMRAYMRSTYDRTGNNRRADASHFLYQEADSFNVTLDVKNPGILYFKRTNHFHGSPWHYEVDGEDFIVQETATLDPVDAKNKYSTTKFLPEALFPHPLTWTWSTTKGADLMWVPIPYADRLRIAYSRTLYGTGYYIYHTFPYGSNYFSRPLERWDKQPPPAAVLTLMNRSGQDLSPPEAQEQAFEIDLAPHQRSVVAHLEGSQMIRMIRFSLPRDQALALGKIRLIITWDHRRHASIDAPLDLFYGAGHLHNPEHKEYLVQGFPLSIKYEDENVVMSCYWPMPFFQHAKIELEERNGQSVEGMYCSIKTIPFQNPPSEVGYFHATYSDHPEPEPGRDLTFLNTNITEGGGSWTGHFVGMSWIFSHKGVLRTLEGDPRFFFDDSKTPQGWGTGTEEWGGGGDYWGGLNMTIPLAGHPVGKDHRKAADSLDLINSAYRFLIADYFPFGKNAKINLEHGGHNSEREHYEGVVYWYGAPFASLMLTDEVNVCHPVDAKLHNYVSPTASTPYELTSRYEWGPDTDVRSGFVGQDSTKNNQARLYFPAQRDQVRMMRGTTRFEMNIDPNNLGILLRRKFDYQYPNQEARVSVRDATSEGPWHDAGTWYSAGSNTCYFSYPRGRPFTEAELLPSSPELITGNRRWREEEFLIGHHLTQGISRLAIKIDWVPNTKVLWPGQSFPVESAWSEGRYWAYSYVMPTSDH